MEGKYHKINDAEKNELTKIIKNFLKSIGGIEFAYLHGSFIAEGAFRDIDIALYINDDNSTDIQFELQLETTLGNLLVPYPVDIRILNSSPLSFRYNVIKFGKPLIIMNDNLRTDFEAATFSNYFDFAPFRNVYLKETTGIEL